MKNINKKILISILIVVIIIIALFFVLNKDETTTGCNQNATTTDCVKIIELQKSNLVQLQDQKKETFFWRKYENNELGFSFIYPTKETDSNNFSLHSGDTGRLFGGGFDLKSGVHISLISLTKDYTAPKGGPSGLTEGFVIKGGKYYAIRRGEIASTPFVPDELWQLKDGSTAVFVKNLSNDFYGPHVYASVNLLNKKEFSGIAFVMSQQLIDCNLPFTEECFEGYLPFTEEDMETFKKIVTSIEFIK
jgi:uncharacterized protein YxeA